MVILVILQETGLLMPMWIPSLYLQGWKIYKPVVSEVHKLWITGLPCHLPLNEVTEEINKRCHDRSYHLTLPHISQKMYRNFSLVYVFWLKSVSLMPKTKTPNIFIKEKLIIKSTQLSILRREQQAYPKNNLERIFKCLFLVADSLFSLVFT